MERSGWVEKRHQERILATLKASYERLDSSRAQKLQEHPDYLTSPEAGGFLNGPNAKSGTTGDVSSGGLSLLGQEPFRVGDKVMVKITIPPIEGAITCLAEVRWTEEFEEMKRRVYRSGLKFLSILREDVIRLDEYVKGRKG